MTNYKYINPDNLFEEDEDEESFVKIYSSSLPESQTISTNGDIVDLEKQRQAILKRQRDIGQLTLESSANSLKLLRESEKIGIVTAEELVRQREALNNANCCLDGINTNLKYSQKHLNGIKSVFSGITNYVSRKSDKPSGSKSSVNAQRPSCSKLNDTIDSFDSLGKATGNSHSYIETRRENRQQEVMSHDQESQRVNEILDDNLNEMLQSVTRLKSLGIAIGEEIKDSNELVDKILGKVERADVNIEKQNKLMNELRWK